MSEITGKLTVKNETKEIGSNGFKKREIVITTEDSKYPQTVLIEFIQDKCALLDPINIGDNIKIYYNLNGREWINPEGVAKYFNTIQGWRIESLGQASTEPKEEPKDDLPF